MTVAELRSARRGASLPNKRLEAYRGAMRVRMLGPLEVLEGARRLELGGPKQRLVLAHLLLRANSVVSASLLIDRVWGDEPPDTARNTLQTYISHLRKVLGAERLIGRPPGYVLQLAPDELDVTRFEALLDRARRVSRADPARASRLLADALRLWHSDPLADLADEPSLGPEIERLSRLRLDALEARIDAELALGRHASAINELERLTAESCSRERLWGQLMLALYRAGRQTEALVAYHRLRARLADEFGVDPSPEIEELQRRILKQDPALDLRGEALRGYRLLERMVEDRGGVVHRAIEPQSGREVAVRVIGARIANDADFVRRFAAEAERLARLEHPHVAAVYDWWREPDAAYLVTRLLPATLEERLSVGEAGAGEAARWAEQIAAGLAAAHRIGLCHGDLRPGAVRFDGDGNAFLSDFALGQSSTDEGDQHALGLILQRLARAGFSEQVATALSAVAARATSEDRYPDVAQLVVELRRALGLPVDIEPVAGTATGTPVRNPYKGLRAFEEADEADFFGRQVLVDRLLARLTRDGRFVALVGPSGSGKTSVVNAGLLPTLRRGGVPGSARWMIARMHPGKRPFDELERALLGVSVGPSDAVAELRDTPPDRFGSLLDAMLPADVGVLLVVDELEELFSLTESKSERTRFLDTIAAAATVSNSRARVVVTLRADFYDRPLRHLRFSELLSSATEAVTPLRPEELERAIEGPAVRAGLSLERGLVTRIVSEMAERPGGLPLLQYVLTELFEQRDGRRLTLAAYERSGGLAGAVARRAEAIVQGLDAPGRLAARQIFLRLVEPGEGTADTARRLRIEELNGVDPPASWPHVLERFARYRLLLFDRDPETRSPTVELAHEALLRAWPRLQGWVDEARDDLRAERRLAAAAAQWIESGREPSYLLTGSRLNQAAEFGATSRVALTGAEQLYLRESMAQRDELARREAERQTRQATTERKAMRRLQALVLALGIGGLVAGGLSMYALAESQRAGREARIAEAREMAAAAMAHLEVDTELSVLLAMEAVVATLTHDGLVLREAEEALHHAVVASRLVSSGPGGSSLAWSPSGDRLANSDPGGASTATVHHLGGDQVPVVVGVSEGDAIQTLDFSPDGRWVAIAGEDVISVWAADSGVPVRVLGDSGECSCHAAAFSPDGSWLAATDHAGGTYVWSTRSWEKLGGPLPGGASLAWSPDSTEIVVTQEQDSLIISLHSGQTLRTLRGQSGTIVDVAWSPAGWIATASATDGTVRIWDAQTAQPAWTVFGDYRAVGWDPVGNRLAAGGADGVARLWEVGVLGPRETMRLGGHPGGITDLAYSPDGERMATAGLDQTVRTWDVRPGGGGELLTLTGQARGPTNAAISPESGRWIASPADVGVRLYDPVTGATQHRSIGEDRSVTAVAFDPGGSLLAAGADDGRVVIWEVAGAAARAPLHEHRQPVIDLSFSRDGAHFATASSDQTILWDAESSTPLWRGGGAVSVAFSQVGLLAMAAEDGLNTVVVLDTASLEPVASLAHAEQVNVVRFDDERLITAGLDGVIRIWDLTGPSDPHDPTPVIATLSTRSQVWDLEVAPDGTRLAGSSHDGTIHLWDIATGRELLTLRAGSQPVWDLAYHPDGSSLLSYDAEGIMRLWALDVDDLLRLAAGRVTRQLTPDECRQFPSATSCALASP